MGTRHFFLRYLNEKDFFSFPFTFWLFSYMWILDRSCSFTSTDLIGTEQRKEVGWVEARQKKETRENLEEKKRWLETTSPTVALCWVELKANQLLQSLSTLDFFYYHYQDIELWSSFRGQIIKTCESRWQIFFFRFHSIGNTHMLVVIWLTCQNEVDVDSGEKGSYRKKASETGFLIYFI